MIKKAYLNNREIFPIEDFVSEMEKRGYKCTGNLEENSKFNGLPKFDGDAKVGLCGPMGGFDNESVCYETWNNFI